MNLTTMTQAINQFLNQYFNTNGRHSAITEDSVLFIFGGGAFTILIGIFLVIYFSRRSTDANKKIKKLEKEHFKRQQEEENKRKAIEVQK